MINKRYVNGLFLLITIGCLTGVLMSAQASPERTIRIAFLGSPEDGDFAGAMAFKQYVEGQTGGRVVVKVYPGGQFCGNTRECIDAMQSGLLDIHMTTVGGIGNFFGPIQVLDLPYALRDDDIAECVFDSQLLDQLREAVLESGLGLRLMTASNTAGWRNFATVNRPINRVEDLRGLKIRTTPAAIQQQLTRQLGASPTPIPWPEVYTSLATQVVDGTKNSVQDIVTMRFHEHIRHIVLDGHGYMGALWWYSEPIWDELPEDLRRILYAAFQRLKVVTRGIPVAEEMSALARFRASGGQVHVLSEAERARFAEAASGVWTWFADRFGEDWVERMEASIATCEQQLEQAYRTAAGD